MPSGLEDKRFDYRACTAGDILRILLIYRLFRLRKPSAPIGEIPGIKCALRAWSYHHLWFLHDWGEGLRTFALRVRRRVFR
jgi:hypothetical protein